jgi:MinD-like ATPase involved in chromosome partitioning or flagellar assembly
VNAITSIATLDRTGAVQATLARLEIDALDELDVTRPRDLDECDVDVDVLVLGTKELSTAGLRRVARWRREHPASVAIAHVSGPVVDRNALHAAGVTHAVRGSLTSAKLRTALGRADDVLWDLLDAAARHDGVETPATADEYDEPTTELAAADLDAAEELPAPVDAKAGRLITIASATGGCGKTFFATSAASVLARLGWSVLLVDLDLQFGEVAAALQIQHPYSIYDGLYRTSGERLPARDFIEHLPDLVHHHELGFDVLTAPRDPVLADYVGARDASVVLDAVLPRYDIVIVDTPPSLNDVVIAAFDRSDLVEVLATPDVPSLRNLGTFTDVLRRLGMPDERMRLVLNKADSDVGVTVAQANDAFDQRFRTVLPVDRAVSRAVNRGTTVPANEPRAKVSKAIVPAIAAMAVELGLALPATSTTTVPQASAAPTNRLFSRIWRRVLSGGNA